MILQKGLWTTALTVGALSIWCTGAAGFPDKPVTFMTGFAAGGSTDIAARAIANELTKKWGTPVVVENRPGASESIAVQATARAAPDGHHMLLVTNGLWVTPSLFNVGYDPVKDVTPISMLLDQPLVLVVATDFPANSVKEIVNLAKSQPGKLNFGSGGTGTIPYLTMVPFMKRTGIEMVNVNYRGAAPTITALMTGEIQMTFQTAAGVAGQIASGMLKALAVTSTTRLGSLPNVPTIAEAANLPGFAMSSYYGVVGPAGLPKDLVARLNTDLIAAAKAADAQGVLSKAGFRIVASSPQQFRTQIQNEVDALKESSPAAGK